MTREELSRLAAECSRDAVKANMDSINRRVAAAFKTDGGALLSAHDAAIRGTVLAVSLAPDIAAATTVQILLRLGLVQTED